MKMTEQECREFKVPCFETIEELTEFIKELDDLNDDYGTAAYAMTLAATASFNYIAHKFGCTGFQASCADLDILRRTRLINGPFMLIKLEDKLYPQYDLPKRLDEFINSDDSRKWLKEEARKRLDDNRNIGSSPIVLAHWKELVK